MSVEEKQQTSRVWMREARSDYEAALVLFKIEKYAIALFHSQQSAEKALKSVAIALDIDLGKTHFLRHI